MAGSVEIETEDQNGGVENSPCFRKQKTQAAAMAAFLSRRAQTKTYPFFRRDQHCAEGPESERSDVGQRPEGPCWGVSWTQTSAKRTRSREVLGISGEERPRGRHGRRYRGNNAGVKKRSNGDRQNEQRKRRAFLLVLYQEIHTRHHHELDRKAGERPSRMIPNRFIFDSSVVRFNPRRAAAPRGPPTMPLASRKTPKI